jgi:hypothetical protein
MKIYWTTKAIPELSSFSTQDAARIWRKVYPKAFWHWQTWIGIFILGLSGGIGTFILINAIDKIKNNSYAGLLLILTLIVAMISGVSYSSIVTEQLRPYIREYIKTPDFRQDLYLEDKFSKKLKVVSYVVWGLVLLLLVAGIVIIIIFKYLTHL